MPHSNPGDVPLWTRHNGAVTLAIQPGINIRTGKSYGYPYGTIPRLLLFWITTEAIRLRSRRLELGGVLSKEQAGPTADELEACRQNASEFKKLWLAIVEQFVSGLGRSIKTLMGENEADVQIECDRKSLVAGDADGQLKLAHELLEKGTPSSQAEALALLREAAVASPSAKTELATCLLKGCPTPAPDTAVATKLLTDAALSGDALALRMLSGNVGPNFFDAESILPPSERYAWSKFLQRLNEEGCFGTADYITWVNFPNPQPGLLTMSPYESTAAEARAADLLARLDQTRDLLGCNST